MLPTKQCGDPHPHAAHEWTERIRTDLVQNECPGVEPDAEESEAA